MSEQNWVHRRHMKDRKLQEKAPDVWRDVREAVQNDCEEFNRGYGNQAAWELEAGGSLRVEFGDASVKAVVDIIIQFDAKTFKITAHYDPTTVVAFPLSSDGENAFPTYGAKRITAQDVSQLILERVFFPEGERRTPWQP